MDEDYNKRKRVPVTSEFARSLFSNPNNYWLEGLPEEAEYVDSYRDDSRQVWFFIYRHSDWDPVDEGDVIPVLKDVKFRPIKCKECDVEVLHDRDKEVHYCPVCDWEFHP